MARRYTWSGKGRDLHHFISSGMEPTPALTYIRRGQKEAEAQEAEAQEAETKKLVEEINSFTRYQIQGFQLNKQPQESPSWIPYQRETLINRLNFLERHNNKLTSERNLIIHNITELENSNNELRDMIGKLRGKLIEQDEVINKLISRGTSGKASIC